MEYRFKEHMAVVTRFRRAKRYFEDDNIPCQIEKGLYLGSVGAANMRITLKTLNVTHILSITCSFARFYPDDFVYKTLLVADSEDANIVKYFNECFAFIDEARARGGGVLVHCFAGKSRSVSIIVGYLMFKNGKSFSEAMRYVKLKRPVASPNVGFRRQLVQYERSLRDTTSTKNIGGFAWFKAMVADKVKKKSTKVDESSSSVAPLQLTDKAVAAIRKELAQVPKELEKEKKKNRERDEAFKLGCRAGAQSLLCSFENKKILSEPLIGRVRSFLQSQSFDTLLASLAATFLGNGFDNCRAQALAAEDLVPDRLEADFFYGLKINEDDFDVDEFSDLVRARLGGLEVATRKPAGEEIPRE